MKNGFKLSFQEVKKRFNNAGYVLLETKYKNNNTKMRFLCKKHGEQKISVAVLTSGTRCRQCWIERFGCSRRTHGLSSHKIYNSYRAMKERCFNKNYHHFNRYGGRGIRICEEWLNDFKVFYNWAIGNGYKKGLTIERKDLNGNYEPSNCKWITMAEQQRNKSNVKFITMGGIKDTIPGHAERLSLKAMTLYMRLRRNYYGKRGVKILYEKNL